eukprot:gene18680-18979_t
MNPFTPELDKYTHEFIKFGQPDEDSCFCRRIKAAVHSLFRYKLKPTLAKCEGINGAFFHKGDLIIQGEASISDNSRLDMLYHSEMGHNWPQLHCDDIRDVENGLASASRLRLQWWKTNPVWSPDHPGWQRVAFYLAQMAMIGVTTFSPELVVFGGALFAGNAGTALLDDVRNGFSNLNRGYLPYDHFAAAPFLVLCASSEDNDLMPTDTNNLQTHDAASPAKPYEKVDLSRLDDQSDAFLVFGESWKCSGLRNQAGKGQAMSNDYDSNGVKKNPYGGHDDRYGKNFSTNDGSSPTTAGTPITIQNGDGTTSPGIWWNGQPGRFRIVTSLGRPTMTPSTHEAVSHHHDSHIGLGSTVEISDGDAEHNPASLMILSALGFRI